MKISAKPLFIAYIVIIVLMVVGMFAFGDNYSFYVHREDPANDEVRFETEPEGIVELRDISATDEYYRVTVRAIKPGKTDGTVIYTLDKDNPGKMQRFNSSEYTVTKFNIIMTDNYGFGGNYFTFIGLAMLFLVTTVFFVWAFLKQFREKFFSYRTILFLGLSLYFAIMTAVFGGIYVLTAARHEYFGSAMFFDYAGNALSFVAVFTSPLVLVFAAFMAISNLMLISKEGFRPVNLLGVFIGVFMICGVVVCFALMYYAPYLIGSEAKDIAIYLLKTAVASAFLYFECILFATIVCLQRAGGYKPYKVVSATVLFREGDYVLVDLDYKTVGRRCLYFKYSAITSAAADQVSLIAYPAVTTSAVQPKFGPGYEYDSVVKKNQSNGSTMQENVVIGSGTQLSVFFEMNGWVFAEFGSILGTIRAWLPANTVQ